jgi:hypothetical protein
LKKLKPWFNEGCSKLLDQEKEAKLQWLQDASQVNLDNLNNIRCQANRHYMNKKREYLKGKSNELVRSRRDKDIRNLYRRINEFKRG